MKLPPFAFLRPRSIAEACGMLRAHPGAKILAGGQSLLVQMMNGEIHPDTLIDINQVEDFSELKLHNGVLAVGAKTRHAELAAFAPGMTAVPLLPLALNHVAHPAIRNRGTVCGSLAFADPAAELPAVALLLDGTLTLASQDGIRQIRARDFFCGPFKTRCRPDELIIDVAFPCAGTAQRFGFAELGARTNDPASIGAVISADLQMACAALVLFGAGGPRMFCPDLPLDAMALGKAVEEALYRTAPGTGRAKLRQAAVLAQRGLRLALTEAPAVV